VLSTNVRDFTVKEQQDEAQRQMSAAGSDNIRIVQRAVAPSTGKSLKKPVLVLAILFGAFSALCIGLVRMFLRPGVQTPASASRTLGMPVLATANQALSSQRFGLPGNPSSASSEGRNPGVREPLFRLGPLSPGATNVNVLGVQRAFHANAFGH
jgi:hypothetical protein